MESRPRQSQKTRIFVNGPGYDDVGSVLLRMGSGFEYRRAKDFLTAPPGNSVLFLNCGGPKPAGAVAVRRFVEAGGTVYASDHQAAFIARAFPDVFGVSEPLPQGRYRASVDDAGLADMIGAAIRLRFDLDDWLYLVPRQGHPVKVHVSIRKSRTLETVLGEGRECLPVVLSYELPQGGALFFTAFHNAVQKSSQAEALLRFLLFRPIMARDLRLTRSALSVEEFRVHREYTGGLRSGAPTAAFHLAEDGYWRALVSWQARARIAARMVDRNGLTVAFQESQTAPLTLTGFASGGARIVVECVEFGQSEVPFCVVLARDTYHGRVSTTSSG